MAPAERIATVRRAAQTQCADKYLRAKRAANAVRYILPSPVAWPALPSLSAEHATIPDALCRTANRDRRFQVATTLRRTCTPRASMQSTECRQVAAETTATLLNSVRPNHVEHALLGPPMRPDVRRGVPVPMPTPGGWRVDRPLQNP
jgi:hypothetical protein